MRVTKAIGHGTVKFGRKASNRIRSHLRAEDMVLAPSVQNGSAQIRWDAIPKERLRTVAGIFGNGKKYVERTVKELRRVNVRFVDDGSNVVLYFGADVCRSLFGVGPDEMNGRQRGVYEIRNDGMDVRPLTTL